MVHTTVRPVFTVLRTAQAEEGTSAYHLERIDTVHLAHMQ